MCGIAGIVSADGSDGIDLSTIRHMCNAIVHRGPDEEGILIKDGAGLGMRRLSIIDLAGGHQPVFNEDRSVWVVYNGEIYNFPELRPQLETRGHRFYTRTDTEVIVHLYEDMGVECVQKLRGMFAFALYDARRRKLLLARDRLGKKPLYYALHNGQLLFASEIKSILAVRPELAKVNDRGLLHYMYLGYIPDPLTSFVPIQKLPPGHLLEYERGEVRVRSYWDLPQFATHCPASEEECLRQLEERLDEAVRIRLLSDVPLGALLSGGTDSSIVVALMARSSGKPVKTFSVGFRQTDFNEAPYARLVADRFGTEHHELILEPDVVDTVQNITHTLEEPFGDSSMLPTYYISCLARQHVTVVLSGDGGDELFAGYDRYRIALMDRAHPWLPDWTRRLYREYLHQHIPHRIPGRNLAYSISLPWRERYLEDVSLQPVLREFDLLSSEFARIGNGEGPLNLAREYLDRAPAKDPLSRLLYLDSKTYLPGDILTKVDRMSMLTSLEARVPILDHMFVEWVTSLGPEWKLRGSRQKYILKRLAERLGVPRDVLARPKQGFALPLVYWTRHDLKDLICTVLEERRTIERGYFNRKGIAQLLSEHFNERRNHSGRLWRLLAFELWHRNFLEKLPTVSSPYSTESAVSLRGDYS
ncbi:MAG: asparagine synthase (glutamine-hydrolyzing) [Acidobacteria bacterium]|nr:asparagine synthase (glutamine-hydrolyzing) [Acidobacteriota bacterium]